MARRNRQNLKREMAQAHYSVDRALIKIRSLHDKFEEHHVEHTAYLKLLIITLIRAQEMMLKFWEIAWGKLPANMASYR